MEPTPLRPTDRPVAREALTILLLILEEKVPGTLAVLTDPRTREAAVAALDRSLRQVLIERGDLVEGPEPPAA